MNKRTVVGAYIDTARSTHGFTYDIASMTYSTLETPSLTLEPWDINDLGVIVGQAGPRYHVTNLAFVARPH